MVAANRSLGKGGRAREAQSLVFWKHPNFAKIRTFGRFWRFVEAG